MNRYWKASPEDKRSYLMLSWLSLPFFLSLTRFFKTTNVSRAIVLGKYICSSTFHYFTYDRKKKKKKKNKTSTWKVILMFSFTMVTVASSRGEKPTAISVFLYPYFLPVCILHSSSEKTMGQTKKNDFWQTISDVTPWK